MKRWLQKLFIYAARQLNRPDPKQQAADLKAENKAIRGLLDDQNAREWRQDAYERIAELAEARQMAGAGPWNVNEVTLQETDALIKRETERLANLKESAFPPGYGASGDYYLQIENIEWRREVSLSWLEFSRWGIQQIILISRLHFIKNPIIRRLIQICSVYVFGRGVEVSTDDETANTVWEDFVERNKTTMGQVALTEQHEWKFYDGNIFWAFFTDTESTGEVNIRTIDATEIQEIVTDPEDSDYPWFYKRQWTQTDFDPNTGLRSDRNTIIKWYPSLKYSQDPKANRGLTQIDSQEIRWEVPILHRKCGGVAKWRFGCPKIYPALDWAKAARKLLEDCATVRRALARIAVTLTTKGGQQALEGAKQQLGTNVANPSGFLWDTNPPPVAGAVFGSGPGTKLEAFKSTGAGGSPEDVRRYLHMCCIVVGVPETFLADVSTGNLATATTLDRPTELVFLAQQEEWREDLVTIATYVLKASSGAASGKLKESANGVAMRIMECGRKRLKNGQWVYEARPKTEGEVRVKCIFPSIREGDIAINVKAIVEAMTLDNKGGQIVGIDEKEGVRLLNEELDIEDSEEVLAKMFPSTYDPDRTKEPLIDPIGRIIPTPGGTPQLPGGQPDVAKDKKVSTTP